MTILKEFSWCKEYGIEYLKPVDTVTFRNYKPTKYV